VNCFEARKRFRPLWQRRISTAGRKQLTEHFGQCAACERAFRIFTLTAPALHSDFPPPGQAVQRATGGVAGPSPFKIDPWPARSAISRWTALGACVSIVAAAGLAAYLAASSAEQTFTDALGNYQPSSELFSGQELPPAPDDLAG
jgi:hypothetical protein